MVAARKKHVGGRIWPSLLRRERLDFEFAQDNGLNVIRSCLNFFTYHHWRIEGFSCHSLCFFKIIHNLVYFPTIHYPTPLSSFSSRYNHDQQFCIPFARTNHLKHSFLSNSVSLWNNLPSQAVTCTTLSLFKYYTLPLF